MQSIKVYYHHPEILFSAIITYLGFLFPDRLYLKLLFRCSMGYWPDLNNPKTFSEKLQWLKLYDRKPIYTTMVDKISAKEYVSKIIGDKYIIPTLGIWDSFDDIDFDRLPNRFVLKTNNGGGNNGVVICKDKTTFNKEKARKRLTKSMKQNIYRTHREWPYKNIKPKIFAEAFLEEINPQKTTDLNDYKWFCFNGEPKYCQVIQGRNTNETIDFFDTEWNHQDFIGLQSSNGVILSSPLKNAKEMPICPHNLKEQVEIARQLSKGLSFSRIDLYEVNEDEFFGEITFFPLSGFGDFSPEGINKKLGDMLNLPGVNLMGGGVKISKLHNNWVFVENDLHDYKFFCFGGKVHALFVASDRNNPYAETKFDYMDINYNKLELWQSHPMSDQIPEKPSCFDEMIFIAEKLSAGIPELRVDLYEVNGAVYFGELTFFHYSGLTPFHPADWDEKWGQLIELPKKNKLRD